MPRSQRKRSSRSPRPNPSLQSDIDILLHNLTLNDDDNKSDSAASDQSSSKGIRKPTEKKLEKVLRYIKLSLRITIERLLTELYLNRMKYGREWAGVKRFVLQRVLKGMSIREWRSILKEIEWSPVQSILREETQALSRTEAFGQFDPNKSLEFMGDMVDEKEVRKHAPHFLDLIYAVGKPIRDPGKEEKNFRKRLIKPAGAILSTICFNMQRKKSNCFPLNLGIFLHKSGLSRNGIETTCSLGLTSSYDTIRRTIESMAGETVDEIRQIGELPTAIPAYDNLEFSIGVHELRDGDTPKFVSVTTGLVHKGVEIPEEGLKRSWFRPKYELRTVDILPLGDHERMQQQERRRKEYLFYFVINAIETAFPKPFHHHIYEDGRPPQFQLPEIERPLEPFQTESYPLNYMPYKESTSEGTQQVVEDIFEKQFGMKEENPQWRSCIRLIFGDALTTKVLHGLKAERSIESDSPYTQLAWLLPVFGLWHLKLNYLRLLWEEHWGGPDNPDDSSSLWTAHHYWHDNKPMDRNQFHRLEELVIHTWQANIVAVMVQIWKEGRIDARNNTKYHIEDVTSFLESQSAEDIARLATEIMNRIRIGGSLRKPIEERDEEWLNHVKFIRNVVPYLVLKAAIKYADIGMLRHAINDCCLVFAGSGRKWLYIRELFYYKWLTDSPATEPQLQKAILYNSLVNRRGAKDSYFEIDRAVELLNGLIKQLRADRHTSSIHEKLLLGRYTQLIKFYERQQEKFREALTRVANPYRGRKPLDDQLYLFARYLVESGVAKEGPGRVSRFNPKDLMAVGCKQLDDKIQRFSDFCKESGLRASELATQLGEVESDSALETDDESDVYASAEEADSRYGSEDEE